MKTRKRSGKKKDFDDRYLLVYKYYTTSFYRSRKNEKFIRNINS